MNPCKCGFYGDATRECRCTPGQIQHYLGKISGPLLDRIDIHVEVPAVPYKELRGDAAGESSAEIRAARRARPRRAAGARLSTTARMPSRLIRKECALDASGERTLEMAVRRMGLSARAHDRILKVARTIADLGGVRDASPPSTSPKPSSTAASTGITGTDTRKGRLPSTASEAGLAKTPQLRRTTSARIADCGRPARYSPRRLGRSRCTRDRLRTGCGSG